LIKEAENLPEVARENNLFAKKVAAKEIFGSNLVLANRSARRNPPSNPLSAAPRGRPKFFRC